MEEVGDVVEILALDLLRFVWISIEAKVYQ